MVFPTETKSTKTLEIQQVSVEVALIGVMVKVADPPATTDTAVDGDIVQVGELGTTLYLHSQTATTKWLAWILL